MPRVGTNISLVHEGLSTNRMEQRGIIRRSRRLRERGRREKNEGRKSVDDDLGVTPVRGKAVNLAEARAMQDARAAAAGFHF